MTQWWLKLMKRYISKSRKLPSKLKPPTHVWTCMWLIGQLLNGRIQYLRQWSIGIPNQKVRDLKHLLGDYVNTEKGMTLLQEQKKLMLYQGALYHCHTLAGELGEVMWFVVPMAHWAAAMNGCHRDAKHQGQQWILYLLQAWFWWPSMATQMHRVISNSKWCIQHEGTHVKAPMHPIIATAPFEAATHRLYKHWDDYGAGSTTL